MQNRIVPLAALCLLACGACSPNQPKTTVSLPETSQAPTVEAAAPADTSSLAVAVFASGCFWCSEEVFEQLNGVKKVVSGYTGGKTRNPSYEEVSTGATGHAEAIQIWYDSALVSYPQLLEIFFASHDPTTLNRQGPDEGTQYRSVIFYRNGLERRLAEGYIRKLSESKEYSAPIVTQLEPLGTFYQAEQYHQDYFRLYPNTPYMRAISRPKADKVKQQFPELFNPGGK